MSAASPFHARNLFLFVTGATPVGTTGRLSTTECTYLPTYLGIHTLWRFPCASIHPSLLFAARTRKVPARACVAVALMTRSPGGPGHGTLQWTRTSEQAGKALRSQGHHCARVM